MNELITMLNEEIEQLKEENRILKIQAQWFRYLEFAYFTALYGIACQIIWFYYRGRIERGRIERIKKILDSVGMIETLNNTKF